MSHSGAVQCKSCGTTEAISPQLKPFKRCAACTVVWYCTRECQKTDWVRHIFHCKGHTITSAHHLALAIREDTLPHDEKTLQDFGFSRAANYPAQSALLAMYRDLVKRLSVSTKTIHSWADRGQLVEEIYATYEKLPINSRGTHYYWFLANKSVMENSAPGSSSAVGLPHSYRFDRRCNLCGVHEGEERESGDLILSHSLKTCAGCKQVWYCSIACQRDDWTAHKVDCKRKSGSTVSTADLLAVAVHDNLLPEDEQTCHDFGFTRAATPENRANLLGVYIGLIERMGIPAKELNRWRLEGRLLQEISTAFEQLPSNCRGGYYPWLMQNPYILETSHPCPQVDPTFDMFVKGFRYAGMSPPQSMDDAFAIAATLPKAQPHCLRFASLILSQSHPPPQMPDDYIDFGFCACKSQQEEGKLGVHWRKLMAMCTFEELCQAYEEASFLKLFESKDLPITNPAIIDALLHSPIQRKSVWRLKQFVLDTKDSEQRPTLSVGVDYGFVNCSTDEERLELKNIYKTVFRDGDPLELHTACLAGKLYEYVSGYYKLTGSLTKKLKYARLLRNVYPLPDI